MLMSVCADAIREQAHLLLEAFSGLNEDAHSSPLLKFNQQQQHEDGGKHDMPAASQTLPLKVTPVPASLQSSIHQSITQRTIHAFCQFIKYSCVNDLVVSCYVLGAQETADCR